MHFGEPFGGILPGPRGAVLSILLRTDAALTGRQIHRLLSDTYSLWSVQETLRVLARLGLVETQVIGRAGVHKINEEHVAVPSLRALVDPIADLKQVVAAAAGPQARTVLLFGSIARGESTAASDIDLAVIAPADWDLGTQLADVVKRRLGNACDVLVFTAEEFDDRARDGEPVVSDILRDGVALVGTKPRLKLGAA